MNVKLPRFRGQLHNLLWGMAYGLGAACFFCAIALFFFAVSGPEVFERNNTSLARVLIGYVLSGWSAGTALGLLKPATRCWVGAAVVGAACTAIAYGLFFATLEGRLSNSAIEGGLFFGAVFGPVVGVITKYRWAKMTREYEEEHGKNSARGVSN